jgi:DNA-binding MarR family transcriptional regulator
VVRQDVSAIDVGQAYFDLHHSLHRVVDRAMASEGLTLARAKVLMRLADNGPMNQATLAGLLGFAPRSVTDTVDALVRDGLVTRKECPNDRRARIVALTPAGQEAQERATAVRVKAMDEIFGSLSTADRAALLALLTSIRNTLPSGENSCVN